MHQREEDVESSARLDPAEVQTYPGHSRSSDRPTLNFGGKMDQPFNKLSPAEAERLALLMEELGEAQQIIGKILRHGYESYHPNDPMQTSNRNLLEKELGDVSVAVEMMSDKADIALDNIEEAAKSKKVKVKKYLHHN